MQWGNTAAEVLAKMHIVKQKELKVVIPLSGGMDSATALYLAKECSSEVQALVFDYGQMHTREITAARSLGWETQVDVKTVDLKSITGLLRSALVQGSELEIPEVAKKKEIPATYVPFRNTIFLSIAAAVAQSLDYNTIVYGANVVDYSGYPDCRPEYIEAMNKVLYTHEDITIEAPLVNLSKAEIVKLGNALHVPWELTWSCYRGEGKACGRCPSCEYRLKGFSEAGMQDPIAYEGNINNGGYVEV